MFDRPHRTGRSPLPPAPICNGFRLPEPKGRTGEHVELLIIDDVIEAARSTLVIGIS